MADHRPQDKMDKEDVEQEEEQLLRQRHHGERRHLPKESEEIESDGEDKMRLDDSVAKIIGQDQGSAFTAILESALSGLPPKWKNWSIRFIFTWLMIGGFCVVIRIGPLALVLTTMAVQVKCFAEIINIGYAVYRVHNLPWFRSLSWYFLVTSNYYFYGESLVSSFGVLVHRSNFLPFLVRYHRIISFGLYVIGFVWFVLSLVKRYYMRQFSLFAWTHVALLIVVTASYMIIQNMFRGLIWFILPIMMVVTNDVMAYVFGFFFGKTPLIQLSPKKTWEGFIGGGISTLFISIALAFWMCQFKYLTCPIEYNEELGRMTHDSCENTADFALQEFTLPETVASLRTVLGMKATVSAYPFLIHAFFLSIFASVIGPFGGFFASGFKRAFKIKDFGDIIPGHGGIMDRFDCQFLMACFVNVYIHSFIISASPQKIFQEIQLLKNEEQIALFEQLQDFLLDRGLLPNAA